MSLFADGQVRLNDVGSLERWWAAGREWVAPSTWVEKVTGQPIVPDFTEGTFWACQYHLYSKGCYTTIYRVFQVAAEELGESYIMKLYD